MARRAFLLARNSGKLKYCAVHAPDGTLVSGDLELMRECLCDVLAFDQIEIVRRDAQSHTITHISASKSSREAVTA